MLKDEKFVCYEVLWAKAIQKIRKMGKENKTFRIRS
jgi:hypothetical protein